MNDYIFLADLLNKYSQLTPWVQASIGLSVCAVMLGTVYFFKEIIVVLIQPFQKTSIPMEAKKEWRDKYYRGAEEEKL